MNIMLLTFFSAIATFFIAISFRVPAKMTITAAVIGSVGYICAKFGGLYLSSEVFGVFLGASVVALLSEIAAKLLRAPASIFIICGIIPLVPGAKLYYTMHELVASNQSVATTNLVQTLLISGAIGGAVAIVSTIWRTIKTF